MHQHFRCQRNARKQSAGGDAGMRVAVAVVLASLFAVSGGCPTACDCDGVAVRCVGLLLKSIPSDIPASTRYLDLSFNQIHHLHPDSFQSWPKLHTLLLSNNRLQHIPGHAYRGLNLLKRLDLHHNQLHEIHPRAFEGLENLNSLNLQSNRIRHLPRGLNETLPGLAILQISANGIQGLQEAELQWLGNLEAVHLSGNPLRCDCSLFSLWNSLRRGRIHTIGGAQCGSPDALSGRDLPSLTTDELGCSAPVLMGAVATSSLRVGAAAALHCPVIGGHPRPIITWSHNNSRLHPGLSYRADVNGSLYINRLSERDSGFWECEAQNALGRVRSKRAQISLPPERHPPLIVKPPRDMEVDLHQSITLDCGLSNAHRARISWTHDGRPLQGTNNIILRRDHMLVRNAEPSDAGVYTCIARTIVAGGPSDSASARVFVRYKPRFTLPTSDISAREGASVKLHCETQAYPEASLLWLFNDRPVQQSRSQTIRRLRPGASVLTIQPVLPHNQGKYTCRASNILGSISASSSLRIRESVSPRLKTYPESQRRALGGSVEFICGGTGEPHPTITWSHNGSPIGFFGGRKRKTEGKLRITDIKQEDAGNYRCVLGNIVGSVSAEARLTIVEDGQPQQPLQVDQGSPVTEEVIRNSVAQARANVDRAINGTRASLYDGKAKSPSEILALFRFPSSGAVELARAREIYEETLSLIQDHVRQGIKLKGDEMGEEKNFHDLLSVSHLQMIMELSGCTPGQFRDPCTDLCRHSKYRSYDGQCNNLERPMEGVSQSAFKRLLSPVYENDFNTPVGWTPEKLYRGFRKPNARDVSLAIAGAAHIESDERLTAMTMQWGQFIDHDLDFAVGSPARQTFTSGAICNATCRNLAPCFNIQMPRQDPRRRGPGPQCIEMERSSAVCGSGETSLIFRRVSRREQLNAITSFIDGSQIYGSSETEALDLRDLFSDHGLLRFDIVSTEARKPYLPFNRDAPIDCQRNNSLDHPFRCFRAGDPRANEQLGLLTMHTLWLREHNRIAASLLNINPSWDGEKIFQEARKILGAQLQHITYQHWLPKIFGPHFQTMLGKYNGYNDSVDARVANAFATAAFRFGHGLVNPFLYRYDGDFLPHKGGHLPLHQAFFAPERLLSEGGVDPILRGLFLAPMKSPQPEALLSRELTERLFEKAHHVALDLAALNIQRGRDHALPEYNEYRRWCSLPVTEDWDQLHDIKSQKMRMKLKELYGAVGNIDLWVGGMLEDPLQGAKIGPTFACIIADQFKRTRDGDRFYYESPGHFTPLQLAEIKKRTLAGILCDNGDNIHRVPDDIFMLQGSKNPQDFQSCVNLPPLNLNLWQDCTCAEACGAYHRPTSADEDFLEEDEMTEAPHRFRRSAAADQTVAELEDRLEGLEAMLAKLSERIAELEEEKDNAETCRNERGDVMKEGARWSPDLCTGCQCKRGKVFCRQTSCPRLDCSKNSQLRLPFQCCPVCQ